MLMSGGNSSNDKIDNLVIRSGSLVSVNPNYLLGHQ